MVTFCCGQHQKLYSEYLDYMKLYKHVGQWRFCSHCIGGSFYSFLYQHVPPWNRHCCLRNRQNETSTNGAIHTFWEVTNLGLAALQVLSLLLHVASLEKKKHRLMAFMTVSSWHRIRDGAFILSTSVTRRRPPCAHFNHPLTYWSRTIIYHTIAPIPSSMDTELPWWRRRRRRQLPYHVDHGNMPMPRSIPWRWRPSWPSVRWMVSWWNWMKCIQCMTLKRTRDIQHDNM